MSSELSRPSELSRSSDLGGSTETPVTPAFDADHAPERDLVDDCVHCGFCLPTCPTYVLWGEEMDSPRGRIHLMQQGLDGAPLDATMVEHFDRCLGCMACVTACPSGVQYDKLIEATRAQVEHQYSRPLSERLTRFALFALFPYPSLLGVVRGPLSWYRRSGLRAWARRRGIINLLPKSVAAMEALLPPARPREVTPRHTAAVGPVRRKVGMLTGCVQRAFFSPVNAATARVLAAEGCDVVAPAGQGCCGALSVHMGREKEAQAFARRLIDAFAGVETVVVNAAGCGSAMKNYGHLLRDDPAYRTRARDFAARVRDVTQVLDELGPVAVRHPLPVRVAYHDACHLAHAQNVRREPRALLGTIPGLEVVEVPEGDICCGSAGVYNVLEPEAAGELGRRKAANVLSTGAQVLVAANPGCLLQISSSLEAAGHPMRLLHTVEVLDASLRGVPLVGAEEEAATSRDLTAPCLDCSSGRSPD